MKISKVLLAVLFAMAFLISLPVASYAQTLDFTTGSLPSGVTMTGGAGTSYYDSSSVLHVANAANHPRFDHNPSNGAVLGILIEPANTNVKYVTDPIAHTDTADLDHPGLGNFVAANTGAWCGVWGDMYPADAKGPDNVTNSCGTFIEDTTLSNDATIGHHSTNNVQPATGSAPFLNQSIVFSGYVKRGVGSRNITEFLIDGGGNSMRFTVDLGTGAIFNSVVGGSWTISSTSVQAVTISGNPWWRLQINGSIGASSSLPWRANFSTCDSTFNDQYQGDGTSSVEIYGLQVSKGSTTTLANSYIQNPSMSGTASSTADSVSFTIPSGIVSLTYTFDDNSTQTVSASPGAFTINPSTLNRPWIKTVVMNSSGSAPNPPTGLSATPGNAQVALTWTASSGATSYNVNRSTTSGSGYSTISSPTVTSYTDTSVTNGTTYYYVVTATNSHGTSGNSNQASATPSSGSNLVANGTYKIVADNSGLAVSAAATSNGSLITQQNYTGAVTEQWTVNNLGSNVDELTVSGTSEALEIPGGSTTEGAQLDISSYTGATYQQWTASAEGGFIQLTNVHSGYCAGVNGDSNSPGATIIQWANNGTTNEEYTFTTVSGGGGGTPIITGQTLGTLRNNFAGGVGFKFTTGGTAITVQGLGRWVVSGNTHAHTLSLVRVSDSVVLGTASVPTSGITAGAYNYVNFGTPVALAASTAYYLVSAETSGGDQWYDDNTTVTTTSAATVNGSIYYESSTYTLFTAGAHSYVPVSFTYTGGGSSGTAIITGQTLGTLRNNFAGGVGFKFTTGGTAITVQGLGRWVVSGNTGAHTLSLVRASDSVVLGTASVPTSGITAGAYNYVNFGTPVALAASTAYYLVSAETSGGDQWYDDNTAVTTTSDATVNGSIYSTGGTYTVFVTGAFSYVPVSFTYTGGGSSGTSFLTGQVLGTARNNLFQTEGFQFTVGSTAITVKSLGRWVISGNTGTHTLTLEKASDNSVLGSVSVATSGAPAGAVKYVNFGTPIPLAANTAYFVQSAETSGGDYCYDDDTTVTTTSVATVNQSIQANINGTPGAHSFGPLSFQY